MKHNSVVTPSIAQRLVAIWTIVEARKVFPVMIVVTGAHATDDTESLARGLAEVANEAGQNVGYLSLAENRSPGDVRAPYANLSIQQSGSFRNTFDTARQSWKLLYDVVFVDAGLMRTDPLGTHAARVADGVIVAVCEERRIGDADRKTSSLLIAVNACLLGAVTTRAFVERKRLPLAHDPSPLEPAPQR